MTKLTLVSASIALFALGACAAQGGTAGVTGTPEAAPTETASARRGAERCVPAGDLTEYAPETSRELSDIQRNNDFIIGGQPLPADQPSSLSHIKTNNPRMTHNSVIYINPPRCSDPKYRAEADKGADAGTGEESVARAE